MAENEKRIQRVDNPKGSYEPVEGAKDNPTPPAPANVRASKHGRDAKQIRPIKSGV